MTADIASLDSCTCGERVVTPGASVEIGGVKHRTDGPCYLCDTRGEPLEQADRIEAKLDALNARIDKIEQLFRGVVEQVAPYVEQAGPVIEKVQRMVDHPMFRMLSGESSEDRRNRRADRRSR